MDEAVSSDTDLAGGKKSESELEALNSTLRFDTQRYWFRWILFVFALVGIGLLGFLFFELEHAVSGILERNPSAEIRWPVLALCSITLLGASALLHSVVRSIFFVKGLQGEIELPQLDLVKQIIEVAKLLKPS